MKKLTQILTVITVAFFVLISFANADSDEYVYKQSFMPRETVEIDLAKTAMSLRILKTISYQKKVLLGG